MSLSNSLRGATFLLRNHPILYTAVRNHWNKDYKPAPYPKTVEERLASAEKYGILPSEYEPLPDTGLGDGDYPKLPDISLDSKDPYYPYDNPELKRNFKEPIHVDFEMIGEDRYDISKRHRTSPAMQWAQFLGAFFGLLGVMTFFESKKMFHSLIPKQYPEEGKTHYTFEPTETNE